MTDPSPVAGALRAPAVALSLRIAKWRATARTGRTHEHTRLACRNVKKPLAPRRPSTHGTIASPWRYDAGANNALQSANLPHLKILDYTSQAAIVEMTRGSGCPRRDQEFLSPGPPARPSRDRLARLPSAPRRLVSPRQATLRAVPAQRLIVLSAARMRRGPC